MTQLRLNVFLIVLCCTVSKAVVANDIELYWAQANDGKVQIMFSHQEDETWSEPSTLYQTETELTSLAIASEANGQKTLVWSEWRQNKMVLMKMQQPSPQAAWGQASIFNDSFKENYAASLVSDLEGQLWLFWSANKSDLDDIYLSKRSNQGWSTPARIHAENKVPDIQPFAYLDSDQNVVVEWRSYDFVVEDYVRLSKTYPLGLGNDTEPALTEEPDLTVASINLPSYLPSDFIGLAHFPNNQFRQTERIDFNK